MTDNKHVTEAFGMHIFKNAHPQMKKIKRKSDSPSLHGNKFWKSSTLLMDYLSEYPLEPKLRVLELGCGYGLGGLYCAKHFTALLTSLDADAAVFPYLELHAQVNGVEATTWQARFQDITKEELADYDVIIGADICFWDDMSEALFKLLQDAKNVGVSRIIITDPGRPPFREVAELAMDELGAECFEWHVNHPYNVSGLVLEI